MRMGICLILLATYCKTVLTMKMDHFWNLTTTVFILNNIPRSQKLLLLLQTFIVLQYVLLSS